MPYDLPIEQNRDLFRRQLNAALNSLGGNASGYGSALPSQVGNDGQLFVVKGSPNKLYQSQGGSWVQVF